MAERRVRGPADRDGGQNAGVADQRVRLRQDRALLPDRDDHHAQQRGRVRGQGQVGEHVSRKDIAHDGRRQRVFPADPARRLGAVVVQELESVSVRETQRGAFDIQIATEGRRRREAIDGRLSDVLAVLVPLPSRRISVRDQDTILPRVEGAPRDPSRFRWRPVLRAYGLPGRVHQLRARQTADDRPGPDQGMFRQKADDGGRAHGGRGENRRRGYRVLQEAQVRGRTADARVPGRVAGVPRQDGRGAVVPDLGHGAPVHRVQRRGAGRPPVGDDQGRGARRPIVSGPVRPVAGGTARRPADGPGGRRVGLPAVPVRRRLSVRVARPRLGSSVPDRDVRRV